jgi:hypothetical protein
MTTLSFSMPGLCTGKMENFLHAEFIFISLFELKTVYALKCSYSSQIQPETSFIQQRKKLNFV